MEELLNEKIIHIKFGVGIIVDVVDNEKIIVEFDELAENKKFEYPDAFECFIKLKNNLKQENTLKQLLDKKVRIAKEKEERRLEFNKQYEKYKKEERKSNKKTRKVSKGR